MSYQANCQLCSWTSAARAERGDADADLFAHEASEEHVRQLARVVTVQHDPSDRGADRVSCALCGVITERLVGGARARLLAHENGPQHQERYAALVSVAEVDQEPDADPHAVLVAEEPVAPAPVYDELRDAARARTSKRRTPAPDAASARRSQSDQPVDVAPRFDRRALFAVAGLTFAFASVLVFLASRDAPSPGELAAAVTATASPVETPTPPPVEPPPLATARPSATAPATSAAALAIVSTPSPTPSATPRATATPAPLRVTVSAGLGELPTGAGGQLLDAYLDVTLRYQDGIAVADAAVRMEPEGSLARTDRWGRVIVPVRTFGTHDLTVDTPAGPQRIRTWVPLVSSLQTPVVHTLALPAPAGTGAPGGDPPCMVTIPSGRLWRGTGSYTTVRIVAAPGTAVNVALADPSTRSIGPPPGTYCGIGPVAPSTLLEVGADGQAWLRGLSPGWYTLQLTRAGAMGFGTLRLDTDTGAWTVVGVRP